jgi:ABC-type nitrate/sulfonate/bicarbonate transport system permease component
MRPLLPPADVTDPARAFRLNGGNGSNTAGEGCRWRIQALARVSLLALIAALVLLWQLAVWISGCSPVLLPSPLAVGRYLVDATADGTLPRAALVTARRLLVGYVIGIVIGLPAGFLLARFRGAADTR